MNAKKADPAKVERCFYCGARKTLVGKRPTIFHKPGCKPNETKGPDGQYQVETLYPGIDHGGYVSADVFGI